jgi:hypothetical protein
MSVRPPERVLAWARVLGAILLPNANPCSVNGLAVEKTLENQPGCLKRLQVGLGSSALTGKPFGAALAVPSLG